MQMTEHIPLRNVELSVNLQRLSYQELQILARKSGLRDSVTEDVLRNNLTRLQQHRSQEIPSSHFRQSVRLGKFVRRNILCVIVLGSMLVGLIFFLIMLYL